MATEENCIKHIFKKEDIDQHKKYKKTVEKINKC